MKTPTFKIFILLAGLVASLQVSADDTDLYLDPNSSLGSEPLVMLSIDYRSNLGSTVCTDASSVDCTAAEYFRTKGSANAQAILADIGSNKLTFFDMLRLSLVEVFDSLSNVRIGLMMSHNQSNNCAGFEVGKCSNGGYILRGFELLDETDSNGAKAQFYKTLLSIPTPQGSVSHSFQGKELYFEFFRYLTGQGIYNGHNGYTDFGSTSTDNIDVDAPGASWDAGIEGAGVNKTRYVTPLAAADQCAKIFVINFLFQVSNQDSDSDSAILATKAAGGMEGINLSGKNNTFDTVIKYMRDVDLADGSFGAADDISGDQSVISYFVVDPTSNNNTTQGYANAGGTTAPLELSDNPEELVETIQDIFREILSVSTTFVAASVPVNVFNRSQSLDNVFIALFQVDDDLNPFWIGNLKKLRIATETDPLTGELTAELVDDGFNTAVAADGRIRFEAVTYWTDISTLPDAEPDSLEVQGADGRVVDRGGAGQKIPGFRSGSPEATNGLGGRTLFYEAATPTNGSPNDFLDLNVDAATIAEVNTILGMADDALAEEYIRYMRGLDVFDEDLDGSKVDARPWILGDPLHSRPLPINFGNLSNNIYTNDMATADPADDEEQEVQSIYIAMAANDGFLHFFQNTDNSGSSDVADGGKELWAFMPRDVMHEIPTLYKNSNGDAHPYLTDGAPSAFLHDEDSSGTIGDDVGDRAILYFGLRRGGNAYYAIDITTPTAPKLLWRIRGTDADFTELGQTWSQPQVATVDTDGDGTDDPIPVVIFSGGYDENKDLRGTALVGSADSTGNAFYVVDAITGALIWKAVHGVTTGAASTSEYWHEKLTDSVPSDLTVVDTDGDGQEDRVYAGDTGGKVWRLDLGGAISNWKITLLANLGSDVDRAEDRRFFHRPDVVQSKDGPGETGKFDAVIIGSGDRANPLDRPTGSTRTINFTYMLKDRNTNPNSATNVVSDQDILHDQLLDITDNCLGTNDVGTCDPDNRLQKGWKLELEQGLGEKVLASPLTLANTIFFTSFLPLGQAGDEIDPVEKQTCGPSEGAGLLYAVKLLDGTPALNYNEYNDSGTDADGDGENDEVLDASDRSTLLSSAGIPSDVVGVNLDGAPFIITGDLKLRKAGESTTWRTYWYKLEDKNSY